jgi:hypothetical protein
MARRRSNELGFALNGSAWGRSKSAIVTLYAADGTTLSPPFSGPTGSGTAANPFTMVGEDPPDFYLDPGIYVRKATVGGVAVADRSFEVTNPSPSGGAGPATAADLPFVPVGSVAATDVQAAIAEVASEATAATTGVTWVAIDPVGTVVQTPTEASSGVGYENPAYARSNGIVYLRGVLIVSADVAAGYIVTTLPAGYRPAGVRALTRHQPNNGRPMRVAANGEISFPGGLFGGDIVSLDGVVIPLP